MMDAYNYNHKGWAKAFAYRLHLYDNGDEHHRVFYVLSQVKILLYLNEIKKVIMEKYQLIHCDPHPH